LVIEISSPKRLPVGDDRPNEPSQHDQSNRKAVIEAVTPSTRRKLSGARRCEVGHLSSLSSEITGIYLKGREYRPEFLIRIPFYLAIWPSKH
jgi:hypothetical protein